MVDKKIGYGNPPKHIRWQQGQSGNPKGRPKSRCDLLKDAAAILSESVRTRTPVGRTVSLDGLEAAYLALCKKGLKGDVPALIKAIKIMMEVQPAVDDKLEKKRQERADFIGKLESLGLPTEAVRNRPLDDS